MTISQSLRLGSNSIPKNARTGYSPGWRPFPQLPISKDLDISAATLASILLQSLHGIALRSQMGTTSQRIVHDDGDCINPAQFKRVGHQGLRIENDKLSSVSVQSSDGFENHTQSE